MSEPKNYHASREPLDRTVLCAELPADPTDRCWSRSDAGPARHYCDWLGQLGLPVEVPVVTTVTRRLRYCYPVYDRGYEVNFRVVDEWLSQLDGFLTYGRQGLFAHDNTHHAMAMGYAACDCLRPDGSFDRARWAEYRKEFESHVVED
jgi:protoporphyrinogen oxidase